MKLIIRVRWLVLLLALFLSGCKVELYSNLREDEANQMMALLMLRKIDAEKIQIKSGSVAIHVEKGQFIDAVEVLRQNGLPERKHDGMTELFPANQLVTSPAQEQAKMVYLKEQQLEKMLSGMDGVILSLVSIAEAQETASRELGVPSASVFIKYNPEVNLANREAEIKSLVHDAIPNLIPENISVVMQAAVFRYASNSTDSAPSGALATTPKEVLSKAPPDIVRYRLWLIAVLAILLVALATLFLLRKRGR